MLFFDGFIDSYFLYNLEKPKVEKRLYTTQAVTVSNPSINLAHAGVNLTDKKFRGRFAIQTGDSVKANTIYEPNQKLGKIQESYLGYRINPRTWLDGGIYLSHIGMESWISQKNMTYTRSMLLDYVPYYSLGLKISQELDKNNYFEFHFMNGWQIISETNSAKSFGLKYKKKFSDFVFIYNNFLGDERIISGQKSRFRTYHNVIGEFKLSGSWKTQFSIDFGTQAQQKNDGVDTWNAQAFTTQYKINPKNFLAWRVEHYSDPEQANVKTGTRNGFRVYSTSANYDHHISEMFFWRTEIKYSKSMDKIYPFDSSLSSTDSFFVTSLSLSL